VLVGRAAEQSRIASLLDGARAGLGGTLVVVGEPGVGKSTLLDQAAAGADGMTVLRCCGCETEVDLAFSGFADLASGLDFGPDVLPETQASVLAGALAIGPPAEARLFTLVAAAHALVATAAQRRAVLLLADDAQWLDVATQRALLYIARRAHLLSLAVLIAVRDDDEATSVRSAGLPELLVGGLRPRDADQLLLRLDPVLDAGVRRRLTRGTGGNPLALIELVGMLDVDQRRGATPLPDPLPAGGAIERAYLRRFHVLPDGVQRLLVLVSASDTGDVEEVNAAARALGLEPAAVGLAERTGLVVVDGNRVVFRHPLARSAVYDSADTPARRAAHRALATALGGVAAGDRAAWHAAAGAEERDEDVAAALEDAAVRIRGRVGHGAAIDAFERAADLTPDPERRARRLLEAARDAQVAARFADVDRLIDVGLANTNDPLLRADLQFVRGRGMLFRAPANDTYALLVAEAERVEPVDPVRAAALLSEAAGTRFITGDVHTAVAVAQRAHAIGLRLGAHLDYVTTPRLAECLLAHGDDTAWALLQPWLERVDATDTVVASRDLALAAHALLWLERFDDSRRLHDALIGRARSRSAVALLPYLLASRAELNFRTGDWAAAETDANDAAAAGLEFGVPALHAMSTHQLILLNAARGHRELVLERTPGVLQTVAELDLFGLIYQVEAALGLLELGLGAPEAAAAHLETAEALREGGGAHQLLVTGGLPDLVESYIRSGDSERAGSALEQLDASAERTQRIWALAGAARCRGLLAATGFDAHFERALELHASHPNGFERARTQLCYAERLRRAGERTDARTWLRLALDTFESLDAVSWADRARRELRATGEHRPSSRRTARSTELTPQELQIARLVATGASNREIAAALFLSTKTVEHHLTTAFRKWGVRSRTQLARMVHDRASDSVASPVSS
jgi:DNA-binding CsgD family transcriptional regulator